MIDVDALRADTPGVAEVIHFNNAGSALMPQPVVDTIRDHLDLEVRCGGYEARDDCADEIDEVYTSIGRLINALPSEIALADNATRAWDMAFYGLDLGAGDRILTTSTEYVSNWAAYLHLRDTRGVVVDVIDDSPTGEIDLEALDRAVDGTVKLIPLHHVPTNSGLVNPAHEVGVIARNHGVPFLHDACQSVGHLPVDVESIGCDMLSATSRKYLRGPRGQGFLYVRDTMLDRVRPPFVELESASVVSPDRYELRSSSRRFETWEKNFANALGLGAAVDYALAVGIDSIWDRIRHLAIALRSGLAGVDGVTLRDIGRLQCGIVTFEVDDHDPEAIKQTLRGQSINVSTSTASSSPIDMHRRGIDRLVRASVHAYNSEEEIESFVRAIARLR